MRFAAVVLAAGAGTRFGGRKLLAPLDGRPILQHVLDALAVTGPVSTVVVLGADAEDLESLIEWRDERRVVNPEPSRGLSSSLRLGIATVQALEDGSATEAIVVLLGDQPRTQPATIHALLEAESDRCIRVPRYSGDGARNPVLLRREAWPLVSKAAGDRGLGAFIDAHPDLVLELPIAGSNPDVDTAGDLAALGDEAPSTPSGV